MSDLIAKLSNSGWKAVKAFADFFKFLAETSMKDFADIILHSEILGPFFEWIFEANIDDLLTALGIADMSVLMFIAVDGIVVIAVLQFIKWILGFIF